MLHIITLQCSDKPNERVLVLLGSRVRCGNCNLLGDVTVTYAITRANCAIVIKREARSQSFAVLAQ